MRILKRLYKITQTHKRFQEAYHRLEDIGFDLRTRQRAGQDVSCCLSKYRKNLKRVDSLYYKWIQ
jgi:hypothetical protein